MILSVLLPVEPVVMPLCGARALCEQLGAAPAMPHISITCCSGVALAWDTETRGTSSLSPFHISHRSSSITTTMGSAEKRRQHHKQRRHEQLRLRPGGARRTSWSRGVEEGGEENGGGNPARKKRRIGQKHGQIHIQSRERRVRHSRAWGAQDPREGGSIR